MLIEKEKILSNLNEINEDIKKYSPFPNLVKILVVTKYFDIEEQKKLIEIGVFNYFGENKAQIYRDKTNQFYDSTIKWDFIGRLQKNKIKYIIGSVNLIHSIDSLELLEEINKKAVEIQREVNVLIQINVSKEDSKTGFFIEDVEKDYHKFFSFENVKVKGLMTMMPLNASTIDLENYFLRVFKLKEKLRETYPYCEELSMGMSNDYIEALKSGSTIIRIGTRLFK